MRLAARLLVFGLGLALGVAVAVPAWVVSVGVRVEEALERRMGGARGLKVLRCLDQR